MEENITSPVKNTPAFFTKHFSSTNLILLLILIVAAILRFHKLTIQSLDHDELQSMLDAAPDLAWDQFFDSIKNGEGVHPPLFFILEKYFLLIFGYNEWCGRALTALAGIGSVWAVYLLGKEIKDEKSGLIAAALLSVNYFNIYYSQEIRMYSFVLLFTTVSYLFFLKACKYMRIKDAALLIIFSSLLIYTHYFGFLVIITQLLLSILFLIQETGKRKKLFIVLFISELIVAVTYIPWLPRLLFTGGLNPHVMWGTLVKWNFFIEYFKEYFGGQLLAWIAFFLIIFNIIKLLANVKKAKSLKTDPFFFSFIFLITSLIIGWGVPYLKSVTFAPMLEARYTIIVLPAVIIAFTLGIELVPNYMIRYSILGVFIVFSLYHLISKKEYYRLITKAEFRGVTRYITSNSQNYPIVNPPSPMDYYLEKYSAKNRAFRGNEEDEIDSILQKKSKKYTFDTFWIVGFYNNPLLAIPKEKYLDTAFAMIKDTVFFGGWAELYARSKNAATTIDYTYFSPGLACNSGEMIIPIWSNSSVTTKPIPFFKGRYKISVQSEGTPVNGIYPHNNLFINGNKIGDFYSGEDYRNHTFYYEVKQDTMATIKVDMDNDASTKNEDRNTFIRKIYLLKMKN